MWLFGGWIQRRCDRLDKLNQPHAAQVLSTQYRTVSLINRDLKVELQIPRSYVAKYAHWLSTTELEHICASKDTQEEHSRLCSRVLLRSALATCLGTGWQLSV